MARDLGPDEIEDIAIGAAVLGSGGGGDPFIGKLMTLQSIEQHGPVKLVTTDELPPDGLVVPAAMMGADGRRREDPNGEELGAAFDALSSYLGQEIVAIVPIEAGGLNSMLPLALSATLGLPALDLDGMGRAFPELQMVTFHLHGISATPMVIADEKGNQSLLQTVDNVWTERLARTLTVQMGGSTMIAIYPMTVAQAAEYGIHGTITLAERLGAVLRESRRGRRSPVDHLSKPEVVSSSSRARSSMLSGALKGASYEVMSSLMVSKATLATASVSRFRMRIWRRRSTGNRLCSGSDRVTRPGDRPPGDNGSSPLRLAHCRCGLSVCRTVAN
ncbi:MAG: DUF917 family protein [Thermomicrobiales bacterium]